MRGAARRRPLILSIGGSIIAPDRPDGKVLRRLRALLDAHPNRQFVLVVGGGAIARVYQAAARRIGVRRDVDLDLLGIRATQLNAELVRVALGARAEPTVYRDVRERPRLRRQVLVAAGFRPGSTTDEKAVRIAVHLRATTVINLSNVAGIYTVDPNRVPSARRLPALTWRAFRRQFSSRHAPGAHVPFDPRASTLAARHGLTVVFLDGRTLVSLRRYLRSGQVDGTVVSP